MGPGERRLAVVSRVRIDGQAAHVTLDCEERRATRTFEIPVGAGETVRVTKFVAMMTDREAPNPLLAAWNLAEGAARDPEKLWADHQADWARLWASRIEVAHPRLQQIVNVSLYQLYCHVREGGVWSPGPTGLSANAWAGHVFWDSDLWMFPGLCLLHPELGRGFVDYRCRTLPGARRNALAEGFAGAMFAWESAEAGDETIPHLFYHHQHHVNSDIALAQWWYALISGDEEYLRNKAALIILESARFWASRAIYNASEDRWEIRGVCCADEWARVQDNNAYTNYSASWNLRLAVRLARRFGLECPDEWETIADKLWIPFDEEKQLYLEYEGYAGQTVKQADTALLVYPYEMPMSNERKANIVDYYRERYPPGNIMMAAAFDGIVDCELGRPAAAWESFRKLLPHFREPFLLASESPLNECISFATGLGGLLQLLLMGFAGIRIREEGLLVHPCVPEEVGDITIYGLHYGGVRFDLLIHEQQATIANASGPVSLLTRPVVNADITEGQ